MKRFKLSIPALGLAMVVGAVVINFGFYFNWFQKIFAGSTTPVTADFRDAGQLYAGDDVRIDGEVEGSVGKIQLLSNGEGSKVTFDLSSGAPEIYRNATASLKWRTLLGGAFYVDLNPGTPSAGPLDGRTITSTSTQVELDDVLGIFRQPERKVLQTLPDQLAQTFSDPTVPATTLTKLDQASPALTQGLRAVQGEYPDSDLHTVISEVNQVARALDQPDQQLQGLVSGAAATLQTTGNRDQDIESILAQGPGTAQQIKTTLASLDVTLADADGLVDRLNTSATRVGPTLQALNPTLVKASSILVKARPLVVSLKPAVKSLVTSGTVGVPFLNAVQPSLSRIATDILPYLGKKDPGTGYSTTVMIGGTAAGFDGAASEMDQNGHYIRFPASIGTRSVYVPCQTDIVDKAATELLACDDLDTALENYFSYVPALSSLTSTMSDVKR